MIPLADIDEVAAANLVQYAATEIRQALSDRRPLEEEWKRNLKDYRSRPEKDVKTFPHQYAANLVIPLIATDVEAIYSRVMGLIFAPDSLWHLRALRPDMADVAPVIEEFLTWAQRYDFDAYTPISEFVLELIKLGTSVLKTRYHRHMQEVLEWRETPEGVRQAERVVMLKDAPKISRVAIYDFLIPASAQDHQAAPWCAERISLTWGQLVERVNAGIYSSPLAQSPSAQMLSGGRNTTLDGITSWYANQRASNVEQLKERLDRVVPAFGDKFEIWEFWTRFDIKGRKGDGQRRALKLVLHLPSMSAIDLSWNPFFNQEYPYSVGRFLRQEGRFYGIGLCEMGKMFQAEVTAMHNQRIDNGTIANSQLYKTLTTSGIRETEPLYPGKILRLHSMDDFEPVQMGSPMNSTISDEQMTLSYWGRRSGVSDYVTGTNTPSIGYSAATTTIEMTRAIAQRFDQFVRELRVTLSDVGTRVLELYQQYNQGQKPYVALGQSDGAIVEKVLQFPLDLIRMSIGVELSASTAKLNKEVQARLNTLVMQQLTQFGTQAIQGMMLYLNPQVPPQLKMLIAQLLVSGQTLMNRILSDYDFEDHEQLIPDIRAALSAGQVAPNGLGGGPPTGLAPQSGMANLPTAGPGSGAVPGFTPPQRF